MKLSTQVRFLFSYPLPIGIAYATKILEYAKLMNRLRRRIAGRVVRPEEVSVESVLSFLRRHVG